MYIPLNLKTNYSLLESLITIDDLIDFAKNNNLNTLCLCDSSMHGVMEFYKKCISNDIKPVIGLEIELNNKKICIYAKNYNGYKNLIKLSTIMTDNDLDFNILNKYKFDILAIIPYNSKELYNDLKDIYEDLYLSFSNKKEMNQLLNVTKNIVFSNEILTLKKENIEYLKYLYMIKHGKTISDDIYIDYSNNYLHTKDIYDYTENIYLNNTFVICDKCNLTLEFHQDLLPIYDTKGEDTDIYLKNLFIKGLNRRLNNQVNDVYKTRLIYELDMIKKLGFSNYFLVVYDFILYAKKNNILVGPGRGSAAGSLVSYTLGITDIDPIKYNLLFERFLNPERKTMPDIDTDFPDIYRDDVINYVKDKYGSKKVCGIVTFGTMAAKLAIRDISRVLNVPSYQVDLLTKRIPTITKDKLKDFYEKDEYFRNMINNDEKLKLMFKIACLIEGFPRHTSSHAAGIVICNSDLDEVIPLTKNDDMYLTGFPYEYLEEIGLLKMDFLGLKNLTLIMNVIEDIRNNEKIDIDFNKIPLDDKLTLNLFKQGDTTGIFQFESVGMRNFLRNLKPDSFEDIFAAIALFRPGPAQNIDSFIRRKEGKEEITYLDSCLEEILSNTYGIIIYQEQIIQVACIYAGYTLGEADILRRAMSKKKFDILKQEEEKFIAKSLEKGHDKYKAKEIFDLILQFANYGFNRSHSVAYSIIAYKMAYLKTRFPKYFYASLLTSVIGVEAKTKEYINEIKGKNIKIIKPSINLSSNKYISVSDGILFPLSNIKNIGTVVSNEIIKIRDNKPFTDIYDFFKRVNNKVLKKNVIENLILSGCFTEFGYNYQTLILNLDNLINYSELCSELDSEFVLKPEIEIYDEFDKNYLIEKEKELFGCYIGNHPATSYKINNNAINLNEIRNYYDKNIVVIGIIDKIKKVTTKKGEDMAFVTLSDEFSVLDVTLFPKTFANCSDIRVNNIVKIYGRVERRYDTFQLVASKLEILN